MFLIEWLVFLFFLFTGLAMLGGTLWLVGGTIYVVISTGIRNLLVWSGFIEPKGYRNENSPSVHP